MAADVFAHMGDEKTVHMVKASASYDGDVLVSTLAHCGSTYRGRQTLGAITCRRCLKTYAAQWIRVLGVSD